MSRRPSATTHQRRPRLLETSAVWIVPASAPEQRRWLLWICPHCQAEQVNAPAKVSERVREWRCVHDVVKRAGGGRKVERITAQPIMRESAIVCCEACRRKALARIVGRRYQPEPVTRDVAQLVEAYTRAAHSGDNGQASGGQP